MLTHLAPAMHALFVPGSLTDATVTRDPLVVCTVCTARSAAEPGLRAHIRASVGAAVEGIAWDGESMRQGKAGDASPHGPNALLR